MDTLKSFFSDLWSVHIKKFVKEYEVKLFILATITSILITSVFCGIDIKYTIAIILITNQVFLRSEGWHSQSKKSCIILSTIIFTMFSYLSSIIVVSPVAVIVAICLLDYSKIEQHTVLLMCFILGVSNPNYSFLMSVCLFSAILSYLVSGSNKISIKIISEIDSILCKLFK